MKLTTFLQEGIARKLAPTFIISASVVIAAPYNADAQTIIFQHIGSVDPVVSEGWLQIGADAVVGPTNDSGTSAWFVDDNSTSNLSVLGYSRSPSAAQVASAFALGWNLTLSLRVVDIPDAMPAGSPTALYRDGSALYAMHFGTEADGDPIVHLPTALSVPSPGPSFTLQGGGSGYHIYRLSYDPASASVNLFVDDVERLSNYTGIPNMNQPHVAWGAGTGMDTGQGNFSLVQFEIVPEPRVILLVALAFLGLPFVPGFKRSEVRQWKR